MTLDRNRWPEEHVNKLLGLVDTNKDGRIQYKEFLNFIFGQSGYSKAHQEFLETIDKLAPSPEAEQVRRTAHTEVERQRLNKCIDRIDCLRTEEAQKKSLKEIIRGVRSLVDLKFVMPAGIKARLVSLGRMLQNPGEKTAENRFGSAMLQAFDSMTKVVMLLDQSGSVGEGVFYAQLIPAADTIAQEISSRRRDIYWGAVAYGKVEVVAGQTAMIRDVGRFTQLLREHRYAGNTTPTDMALLTALKVTGAERGDGQVRIMFNFTDGQPNDIKRTQAAFKHVEDKGVLVIGVGVGDGINEEQLRTFSSDGMVFKVDNFEKLKAFVEGSFSWLQDNLTKAQSMTVEELLEELTPFC